MIETINVLVIDRQGRERLVAWRPVACEGGSVGMDAGIAKGEIWLPATKADAEALRDHFQATVELWKMPRRGKKRIKQRKVEAWRSKRPDED